MLIELIHTHTEEARKARSAESALRASSSGKCARAIAYQMHGIEGAPIPARGLLVFELGNTIENQIVSILKNHGLTDMQRECFLEIEGKKIYGHIDGIFNDVVIDVKSCAEMKFKEVMRTNDPGQDYIYQMQFYLHALDKQHGLFLYYNKNTSAMHEVPVERNDIFLDDIKKRFASVINSTPETLPRREYGANEKGILPWQCSYCSWVAKCQTGFELELNNGKPRYTKKPF